jgi:tetratricopeptide (TPR) repeat protein
MKVAVLPFNVAEGTKPAYGRQFANFAAETVRAATGADIQSVSYMAQVQEDGGLRTAHVNMGAVVLEREAMNPIFKEGGVDRIMHGLLSEQNGQFLLKVRIEAVDEEAPLLDEDHSFSEAEAIEELHRLMLLLAAHAGVVLPPALEAKLDVGTTNPQAFLHFIEGFDGFQYIQQANGAVSSQFKPSNAIESLLAAVDADPTFTSPFDLTIQICRSCAHYRIGIFDDVEKALKRLSEIAPEDYRPYAALGEVYQAVGNVPSAVDAYEKALASNLKLGDALDAGQMVERAAIYSRLGMAQLNMGMPVNAERNFRKAVELEQLPKPSLDLLASVLAQTNRVHEIPALWKSEITASPNNALARARYAGSLLQNGQKDEAIAVFEQGLEEVENKVLVKRFYAPVLAETGDFDRAMDFYEDCLDVEPNDIPLLIEYANTLKAADREFEVPQILKNVLSSNPDPNIRAQTLGWLIEIEQPKRAEAVEEAKGKIERGDFDGALKDLRPLRNWLADYWKLWALMSTAANQVGLPEEAQEAANKLLALYPGYEPGYGELAAALTKLDKLEEAYNVMRYAASNLKTLDAHVNLALAAKRAGHNDEARSIAKQIREAVGANQELEPVLAEIEA